MASLELLTVLDGWFCKQLEILAFPDHGGVNAVVAAGVVEEDELLKGAETEISSTSLGMRDLVREGGEWAPSECSIGTS